MGKITDPINMGNSSLINFAANRFRDEYLNMPVDTPRYIQTLDQPSCLCWYVTGAESWVVIADKRRTAPRANDDRLFRLTIHHEKVGGGHIAQRPMFFVKSWGEVIIVGSDIARQLQCVPSTGYEKYEYPHGSLGLTLAVIAWCYMDDGQRCAARERWHHWIPCHCEWLAEEYLLTKEGYMQRGQYQKILDVVKMERELPDRKARYRAYQ